MALLDIEKYYYFKVRNGQPYEIKVTVIHINTTINRLYQEMTTEQKEFYLEHPEATVIEVWNCHITPPPTPPTPDLQEYAARKVKDLKDACYASITVDELQYAMAEDKVNNVLADSYYSLTEANAILASFRTQSKKAMQVFDTYSVQMLAASTIEAIDSLYNQAIAAL